MIVLGVSAAFDAASSDDFFLAAAVLMLPMSVVWWFGGGLFAVSVCDAWGSWAALVFAAPFALGVAVANALLWLEVMRVAHHRFQK